MSDVTRLLDAAAAGDPKAAAELRPLVSDELRLLAARRTAAEVPDHTPDVTALVREAYLRHRGDQHYDGRSYFFAATADRQALSASTTSPRCSTSGPSRPRLLEASAALKAVSGPHLSWAREAERQVFQMPALSLVVRERRSPPASSMPLK
jgi:hypothetical protein